jgi:hypothetical protein
MSNRSELDDNQRQQRVAQLLAAGGPSTPNALRTRLDALYADAHPRSMRGGRATRRLALRSRWAVVVAGLAAVGVAVAVVSTVTAGPASSSLAATRVAAVWTLPATSNAIGPSAGNPAVLDVSLHGTAFPNYTDAEGWHPSGARVDEIAGNETRTVFYSVGRRRAAYTVVAGAPVSVPAGARTFVADGLRLSEFRAGDRWIIVFRNNGNSCVLIAAAPREKSWLVKLAVWRSGRSGTAPA